MLRTYLIRSIVVSILLLLLSLPPSSQASGEATTLPPRPQPGATLHFTQLGTQDGLSQSHVDAILQDSRGFMWFGTWDGLDRYNGYTFKSYKHDPTDPSSLGSNTILDLMEDRHGFIWVATRSGGINRFDPRTETFTRYPYDINNPNSPGNNTVFSLAEGENGEIWLGLEGGQLNKFDPATGVFTRYHLEREGGGAFGNLPIWEIQVMPDGVIWLALLKPLRVDTKTGEVTSFNFSNNTVEHGKLQPRTEGGPPPGDGSPGGGPPGDGPPGGGPPPGDGPPGAGTPPEGPPPANADPSPASPGASDNPPLGSGDVHDIYLDSSGTLWFAGQGVYEFDPATEQGTFYPFPASAASMSSSFDVDASGLFWIGTREGLHTFDPQSKQYLQYYRHDATNPGSLASDMTEAIYTSREEGIVWVGTVESGISKLDLWQTQFANYRHEPENPNSFADAQLGAIYKDSAGILWIGSGRGLTRFDRSTGEMTTFELPTTSRRGGRPESQGIGRIYEDQEGFLWFDGIDALYRFDPTTETLKRYHPPESDMMDIWSMAPDEAGDLWITSTSALYHFDIRREQFTTLRNDPDNPDSLGTGAPFAVYVDRAGDVWVGSANGVLDRLDRQSGQFHHYLHDPNDPATVSSGWMQVIYEDQAGTLWIGAMDGLNRYDRASDSFTRYTQRDGLPSASIQGILEDEQGHLWLSTVRGLSRMNPETGEFRTYDVADGLQGEVFSLFSFHEAADGEMFFGSRDGLTAFYPSQIQDNPYSPRVVLTDFQLRNKSVTPNGNPPILQAPIWETEQLTLAHNEDVVTFEFASLSYAAPEKNRYRYKLEGVTDWNEVGSDRRFAPYTNLPTGNYVLRVQGSNKDGVWSEHEVALPLVVQPPWWETWWFQGSVLLLLVALLFSGYRWRIHAMQARNRELEREVAVRTEALVESNLELQEAKKAAEAAKEAADSANQAKSIFLANMSHELRSPLNAILGFAQIMGNSPTLGQEDREHMGIIQRSGEHLLTLINQVLDMSKIEANRTTLNERNFNLHQLLEDLEDMFALKADDENLTLLVEHDPSLPKYVRTDETKLRQVLINLLNNALKFTEEGGVAVRVAVVNLSSDRCRLRFEVEDSGPGIAPEEMDQLFEAFGQTTTGRQAQEGTGLGLPISRKFVQLMGGDMAVHSQVGQGTVFSFEIEAQPAEAEDETLGRLRRRVVGLEPGQPRYRILVADDKWTNRQLLVKMLEPLGFEVREAENGQEAVQLWEEWEPHLIWMDMRMPVLNGYEAVRQIKSTTKGQATAIIALTASTLEEERAMVLSAGCDEFMRKPFREADIFDIMQRQIGVQYVYEEDTSPSALSPATQITPSMLAALPPEWLEGFQAAVVRLDMGAMLGNLDEIQAQHSTLATGLKAMVNTFDYEQLLRLLEEVRNGNGVGERHDHG